MNIRVLIVDDEPLARKGIRRLLEKEPDIEIIGECSDGLEAVETINNEKPDIVFLDIQMPELDGFGVLEALELPQLPIIIFITAFDEFALKAFEVHALDYLLKPVKAEKFQHALQRARAVLHFKQTDQFQKQLESMLQYVSSKRQYLERLIVKDVKGIVIVYVSDVDWFEAYGDYIRIHEKGKKYLLRKTMNTLESGLNPENFARIHRSTIVQINRIKKLQPLNNGDYVIFLEDGTQLSLSRTYSKAFLEKIGGDVK